MLSHGDMWVNNVFFNKDDEDNLTEEVCAFLDWQVAHAGNQIGGRLVGIIEDSSLDTGLNDFCHLVLLGATKELKERNLDKWLQLYYGTFSRACKRYNVENPYTLELVHQMYAHHYKPEASFALVVLGLSFDKATCDEQRHSMLDRIESLFEAVRGE